MKNIALFVTNKQTNKPARLSYSSVVQAGAIQVHVLVCVVVTVTECSTSNCCAGPPKNEQTTKQTKQNKTKQGVWLKILFSGSLNLKLNLSGSYVKIPLPQKNVCLIQ